MTTYSHDDCDSVVFIKVFDRENNHIHYEAVPEEDYLPQLHAALATGDWTSLYWLLVRTVKEEQPDGLYCRYAPLSVCMEGKPKDLPWFLKEPRARLEEKLKPKTKLQALFSRLKGK